MVPCSRCSHPRAMAMMKCKERISTTKIYLDPSKMSAMTVIGRTRMSAVSWNDPLSGQHGLVGWRDHRFRLYKRSRQASVSLSERLFMRP